MSAETLRRAADLMRRNVEAGGLNSPHTTNCGYDQIEFGAGCECRTPAVGLALADWLDAEAAVSENFVPLLDMVNLAYEKVGAPKGYLQFGRTEDGQIEMRSDTSPAALAVALAYLGESA